MTTVVLGWDGLDYELAHQFGVAEAFGPHRDEIDTIVNPVLETPHTRELWPTIITGSRPEKHGFRVGTPGESLDWDNPTLDLASDIASYVIPHSARAWIGRRLRNAGADLDDATPAEYDSRGLETVFKGRDGVALALPNYVTERSKRLGLGGSRKATFRAFMRVGDGGGIEVRDETDVGELEQRLWSAAGKKLGAVRAAIERDHDIVWVWLGYLDTIGHVAPALSAGGLQERGYRQAAAWTDQVRAAMQPEDTLVCVSDHGLQDGDHTHTAFIGSTDPGIVDDTEHVTDVRSAIDAATPTYPGTGQTPIREPYQASEASKSADASEVRDQLESLGYI